MKNEQVIPQVNIQEYFREVVASALANQKKEADEETVFYVVNLLAYFIRTERLFIDTEEGVMLQPLAQIYAEAVNATSTEEQSRSLQRLGDVALLIAGVFSDSLNRKLVDVDYYIAMGGSAYGHLADLIKDSFRGRALGGIFSELSHKFGDFVEVLGEVSERAHLTSSSDVMRLYEVWLRTGSKRAEARLRRLGIDPIPGLIHQH